MYITKEELEARLKKTELRIIERTRKPRSEEKRLTDKEREMIGILESIDTQKEIAELMGVSQTTVSNVSRGMVAPPAGLNKELKQAVERGKEEIAEERLNTEKKIQEQLITNLAAALGHVSNNIHNTKATEASQIAMNMSKILDTVSGSKQAQVSNRTAIIINVPSMKEEKNYPVIEV